MTHRRSLLIGACCSFLTGIGAAMLAAWFQLQYENRREERTVWALDKKIEELELDVSASRGEAKEGINHVRSLLRAPRVSESDRETDIAAAQRWVRRMVEVD